MPNFSSLRAATAVAPVRTLTLYGLVKPGRPDIELDVKPATESNPPYLNARIKAESAEPIFRAAARGNATADVAIASRAIDLKLFPETVIVGWRYVDDDAGVAVTFTPEVCAEFLAAIGLRFDEVRDYCKAIPNFMGGADATAVAKH